MMNAGTKNNPMHAKADALKISHRDPRRLDGRSRDGCIWFGDTEAPGGLRPRFLARASLYRTHQEKAPARASGPRQPIWFYFLPLNPRLTRSNRASQLLGRTNHTGLRCKVLVVAQVVNILELRRSRR